MKRPVKIVLAVAIGAVILGVVAPWAYITFIRDDAPDALSLEITETTGGATPTTAGSASSTGLTDPTGEWTASPESVVGYRVDEILFGQDVTAVGRTSSVTGSLSVAGTQVTRAEFTVEMATIQSDSARRDGQFNGRIMDVATYPTATFTLTSPIALPENAMSGEVIEADATGELTLRGLMKPVDVKVQAQMTGQTFTVVGTIKIVFAEWGIPEPSIGAITVEPDGLLEFSLVFARADGQG